MEKPYGGFFKRGYPNCWMVYFMENPKIKWNDLGLPFMETSMQRRSVGEYVWVIRLATRYESQGMVIPEKDLSKKR